MLAEVQTPRHHHPINMVVLTLKRARGASTFTQLFLSAPGYTAAPQDRTWGCGSEVVVNGHGGGAGVWRGCFPTSMTQRPHRGRDSFAGMSAELTAPEGDTSHSREPEGITAPLRLEKAFRIKANLSY